MFARRSLESIQKDLFEGSLTTIELVTSYLSEIEKHRNLNAFIEVFEHEAIETAKALDKKIAAGDAGKLAGLVIGIKDLISYEGHSAQGASKILEGYQCTFSATAIQRLIDQDAIIIGRQNCDEFGMGSGNENSSFGPVKNGIDPSLVSGGSSGGSAVAVQMGMCHVSIGTDTGGSVRQPAAFCGVVGLKPTYGRISRYGLFSYASSFDTIGIISNNIQDNARVLEIMAGKDELDSTVSSKSVESYSMERESKPKTFCYFTDILAGRNALKGIAREAFEKDIDRVKQAGHSVEQVDFPLLEKVLPAYYILTMAEASSNLSRYDGVHYGHRSDSARTLNDVYYNSRTQGFGAEVQRRIMLGTFVLSAGYYDAYYEKAQKVRRLVKNQITDILSKYDFIISPTSPSSAFRIGEERTNPIETYLEDLFTVTPSMAGIPAISIPSVSKNGNLPLGLQIIGSEFEENELYAISEELISRV